MLNTLSYIGERLNNEKILWGVGASILLNHHGLVENPKDIDILVDIKDIEKLDLILKSIGTKKSREKTDTYSTEYFYEYVVNGFDVDVMAGLQINHSLGVFEYTFDESSISEFKKINRIDIPLTSLEDWYIIYQLIPGRDYKVKIIQDYLIQKGIKKPHLLERALRGNLPGEVRERVKELMENFNCKRS